MRQGYITIILLICCFTANAQQNYDASLIPKELLPYASSVIRNEETTVEIKDLDNVIYHVKEAITILNKNGDKDAEIELEHGKTEIINYVKGAIYNESGKKESEFSKSAFEDVNEQDGFSLFIDKKVIYFHPTGAIYPYTIEYEYEKRNKESFDFDDWRPNPGIGIAVQNSSFTLTCKPSFDIRYKEINIPSPATISTTANGGKVYVWQASNLKAIKNEPYSPNPDKYLSIVKIAPTKFIYGGMSGNCTTWNDWGKWVNDNLWFNRQTLSAETISKVQQLTADITDPKLKAKKIYEYMQNKTHYVNVTIGIGGYQPVLASDVDKLSYGDCKALVNYTRALLKAVDIDSYFCFVMADTKHKISLPGDFPAMGQANHAILCIPFKNDTTWCDCTSQTWPFGYLGDFTDDRIALAFTPTGGKLMHTPKYTAGDNLEDRKADFILNGDGELSGKMTTNFSGVDYDNRDGLIEESHTEQLKDIQRYYPINNMSIQKLVFKQDKSLKPVTTEETDLNAPEYASVDNGKIVFLVDAANRMYHAPHEVMSRKTDVYINEGYTDEDEITYTLPAGYREDSEPLAVAVKTQFGSFTATSTVKDGKLVYKRRLQVIDGTYPKDSYQRLVDFFQQVVDADAYSVTLVKTAN